MTEESWAPEEITEEQEAEMAKENAEASEDQPAQLNSRSEEDPDDPPQIDRRSPAERFIPEEKKEDDAETKKETKEEKVVETKTSEETKEEKAAESKEGEEQDQDTTERKRPKWWGDIPKEAQDYIDNQYGARHKAQKIRQEEAAESERRFKKMTETISDKIAQGIKEAQPKPPEPDPDIDPEGFKEYHVNKSAEAEKIAEETAKTASQQDSNQELLQWMGKQEAVDPDFMPAFNHLKNSLMEEELAKGHSRAAAEDRVSQMGFEMGRQLYEEEGDWTKAVKYYAAQSGWKQNEAEETTQPEKKSSGEDTAAAIEKGQAAAKGLGKGGGGGGTGVLTLEDIWNIKDPEEHDKAYQTWIDEATNQSPDWTPN